MTLQGQELERYLKTLIVPKGDRGKNNYPDQVEVQSRRANSKWLRRVLNSGRFSSMYRTINVVTFIPEQTSKKEPVVIFEQNIGFMKTLAFAKSPGATYLANIDNWKTCLYKELKQIIQNNPDFQDLGFQNMITGFDREISSELTKGEDLRSFYSDTFKKYQSALKGTKQIKQLYKVDVIMKEKVNKLGRLLEQRGGTENFTRGLKNKIISEMKINVGDIGLKPLQKAVAPRLTVAVRTGKKMVSKIRKFK